VCNCLIDGGELILSPARKSKGLLVVIIAPHAKAPDPRQNAPVQYWNVSSSLHFKLATLVKGEVECPFPGAHRGGLDALELNGGKGTIPGKVPEFSSPS
jgi:hypothetical protein